MRRVGPLSTLALLAAGAVFAAPLVSRSAQDPFPHEEHANMFPLCSTCHAGVVETGQPLYPEPVRCAACHDGIVQPRVEWRQPAGPRPGNLKFTHFTHDSAVTLNHPGDSAMIRDCSACHNQAGTVRMAVQNAVVGNCLECHGLKEPHVDVASSECATCHVRLTEAPGLTRDDISKFPRPSSHDSPGFAERQHGILARASNGLPGESGIAASCATCHARNLCLSCHVNAAESPVIAALEVDDRSPVFAGTARVPPSHLAGGFLRHHGRDAQRGTATCATCHTRESCLTCHVGAPTRSIAALPVAGPGRAAGAQLTRTPPPSHTVEFREGHGAQANARPRTCETCHVRSSCLECHRPDGAGSQSRYHPQNFLTRHPSSAYAREANCSDCHNPAQFCQACHQQSGLVAAGRIGTAGYHDAFRGFSLGHGQAARQSLESCASCHAERDCTACHSAVGSGFRFNPHGPGFNPERARSKNPSVCIACHGRAIPEGQ